MSLIDFFLNINISKNEYTFYSHLVSLLIIISGNFIGWKNSNQSALKLDETDIRFSKTSSTILKNERIYFDIMCAIKQFKRVHWKEYRRKGGETGKRVVKKHCWRAGWKEGRTMCLH